MRAIEARWMIVLAMAVGVAAMAAEARGAEGRWKLGGDGGCYFDATDSGPDQCSPTLGRWKLGGDGSCYFDANDGGADQCTPVESAPAELTADDEVALPAAANSAVLANNVDRDAVAPRHPLGSPSAG